MSHREISISELEVTREGEPAGSIPNQFMRQENGSDSLAVIFPGLNYNCHKPLLYYTTEALLARGADVLQLWADYTAPSFAGLSKIEQARQLAADGQVLLEAGRGSYRHLILVGKSIGTLTIALLVNFQEDLRSATTIWLTPLLHVPQVAQAALQVSGPALFAGGTQDSTYDPAVVAQLESRPNANALTIPGGDHSLNIEGDPLASVRALLEVVQALTTLLEARA